MLPDFIAGMVFAGNMGTTLMLPMIAWHRRMLRATRCAHCACDLRLVRNTSTKPPAENLRVVISKRWSMPVMEWNVMKGECHVERRMETGIRL
jgi:hypothetical protein